MIPVFLVGFCMAGCGEFRPVILWCLPQFAPAPYTPTPYLCGAASCCAVTQGHLAHKGAPTHG